MIKEGLALSNLYSLRKFESILGYSREYLQNAVRRAGSFYSPFGDRKIGAKKWRLIDNPSNELKQIQSRIKRKFFDEFEFPETIVGGVKGRSTPDNSSFHVGKSVVVKLDLKKCFPRTSNVMVYKQLVDVFGCSAQIASIITKLTTFQRRVPQGAPTSSFLANLVLMKLHDNLKIYCDKQGLKMSFWVDDITVSGDCVKDKINDLVSIIHKHDYTIAIKKLEIMPKNNKQEVVGLGVNRKVAINRKYYEGLRKEIISHKDSESIEIGNLQKIKGKMNHIGRISKPKREKLLNLSEKILPKKTVKVKKKNSRERFRVKSGDKFLKKIKQLEVAAAG